MRTPTPEVKYEIDSNTDASRSLLVRPFVGERPNLGSYHFPNSATPMPVIQEPLNSAFPDSF